MDPLPAPEPCSPDDVPDEHAAIARWTLGLERDDEAGTGPGDDCALLLGLPAVSVSVDTAVEGVHFRLDWSSPTDAGWRAVACALSDLAAGRAAPRGALIALTVRPEDLRGGAVADQLMTGVGEALRAYGCPLLGGDTVCSPGARSISVTVLGAPTAAGPLRRSGGRAGDLLQLSGPLGWAAFAVRELLAGRTPPPRALRAHQRPRARLDLLDALAAATAGIDVSDGLLADAGHLARRSGVALRIDEAAATAGAAPGAALSGGDDYELLVTAPMALPGFTVVGAVVDGAPGTLSFADGRPVPPQQRGWDHGRMAS